MEASGSFLVDQGTYTRRNNPSIPAFISSGGNNGYLMRSTSEQLLLNVPGAGVGAGAGFLRPLPPLYASSPPHAATYSSLPTSTLFQPVQPPLLPLPLSKSFSLPSPSPPSSARRVVGAAAKVRPSSKETKKARSSPAKPHKDPQPGATRPHKEPAAATPPVRVPLPSAPATRHFMGELPNEEDGLTGDVYSLSPPPSSLPMPKFCLRPRAFSSPPACVGETFGGGVLVGTGVDTGASADLRRLLRL